MLWVDHVHLIDLDYYIYDSSNYDTQADIRRSKKHCTLSHLEFSPSFCDNLGIAPTTSSNIKAK